MLYFSHLFTLQKNSWPFISHFSISCLVYPVLQKKRKQNDRNTRRNHAQRTRKILYSLPWKPKQKLKNNSRERLHCHPKIISNISNITSKLNNVFSIHIPWSEYRSHLTSSTFKHTVMFKIFLRSSKTVLCADTVVRQSHWILAKFWRSRFSFVRFVRNSRTFSWWLNAWLRLYWKQTDRLHKNSENSALSTINNRCYYQIYQQQNFCLLVDLWTDWKQC